jgi:hypothetical protein
VPEGVVEKTLLTARLKASPDTNLRSFSKCKAEIQNNALTAALEALLHPKLSVFPQPLKALLIPGQVWHR